LTVDMVGPIEEIAHALARECRFTRQCPRFYSVAEHSCRGSDLLPRAFAGAFLLHELSEVYLPDIASPVKPSLCVAMPDGVTALPWSDLEKIHTRVILESLGLSSIEPLIYSPEVKGMDLAMLAAEKRDFFPNEPEPWGLPPPAACGEICPWSPEVAEGEFLRRFAALFR
jgi:hypothetical protein